VKVNYESLVTKYLFRILGYFWQWKIITLQRRKNPFTKEYDKFGTPCTIFTDFLPAVESPEQIEFRLFNAWKMLSISIRSLKSRYILLRDRSSFFFFWGGKNSCNVSIIYHIFVHLYIKRT